jgi:hypothetical protein
VRVDNWPAVLADKVEEWRGRALDYGHADCFQFAGDVVLALTGLEHRDAFPEYVNRDEATDILREYGGPAGIITSVLGQPKSVGQAMRGDLVVADFGDGPAVGVCLGLHSCTPGIAGLVFVPTNTAISAWTV